MESKKIQPQLSTTNNLATGAFRQWIYTNNIQSAYYLWILQKTYLTNKVCSLVG